MASKKQRAPPPHPPPSSSSSSSSEDDEEEEPSSSSDDQEEQTIIPQSKPDPPIQDQQPEDEEEESSSFSHLEDQTNNPQSKPDPPIQDQQSEDEEDEESSSSSDQQGQTIIPQSKPDPPIKEDLQSYQQSEDEDGEEDEEEEEEENHVPAERTTSEKPSPKSEKKMVVPSKPPNPHNSEPKGKSPIVRFWSLEDEITILRAMIDYQPHNNGGRIKSNAPWVKQLHDSIRKSLSADADTATAKLVEKMRRMRKKYIRASRRGDKLKLANDHDQTIYDLSHKIWGKEEEEAAVGLKACGNSSAAAASKGKSSKRGFPFIRDAFGGNRMALEKLETADVNKAAALEKRFKKLKSVEINYIRKAYKLLR